MNKKLLTVLFALASIAVFASAGDLGISSSNYDPTPAVPGGYISLEVHVFNNSNNDSLNSVFNLNLKGSNETSFPFTLDPQDTPLRNLGKVPANQTVLVRYRILVDPEASDGTYTIKLETGEGGKIIKSVPFTIKVLSRKPTLSVISAAPTEAQIGKTTSLKLSVKNTGSSTAYNISVGVGEDRTVTSTGVVVERSIIPLGAAFYHIDLMAVSAESSVEIPLMINPGATSKAYFIPITLSFYDENKTKYSDTAYVGLKVSDTAEISANFESSEPLAQAGQKSKVTINIYNIGNGTANYLTAKLQSDALSLEQDEFFIGTLEPDDSDTIILSNALVKSSIKPGVYPVKVAFSFKNEFGEEASIVKTVNLKVYSAQEIAEHSQQQSPILLYAIIIVLIVVGFWYFFGRKKKSKKVMG